jgi:hypothetical protein
MILLITTLLVMTILIILNTGDNTTFMDVISKAVISKMCMSIIVSDERISSFVTQTGRCSSQRFSFCLSSSSLSSLVTMASTWYQTKCLFYFVTDDKLECLTPASLSATECIFRNLSLNRKLQISRECFS